MHPLENEFQNLKFINIASLITFKIISFLKIGSDGFKGPGRSISKINGHFVRFSKIPRYLERNGHKRSINVDYIFFFR